MALAPDTGIQFIPRGTTTSRTLRVTDGASDITIASGTYTLYKPDGTSHFSDTFSNNARTLILAADVDLGAGGREAWAFSVDGSAYEVIRRVIITDTLDSRMLLVGTQDVLALHAATFAQYPSGQTSWERQCTAATQHVLQILADRTAQGIGSADLLNADALRFPALYTAVRIIATDGYALTGSAAMAAIADDAESRVNDWLRRMKLVFDTDGDGAADRTDTPGAQTMGRPPPPLTGV